MTHNTHLIKALDSYPYAIEDCIESLNYALAYDNENAAALCLMGRIQSEIIKDNESAKFYYQQALAANKNYVELYPYFIESLYLLEEYHEALRLIEFALKIQGINKGAVYYKQAETYDRMQKAKKALQALDNAGCYANSNRFIEEIEEFRKLIERKQKLINKKEKNPKP